MNDPGGKIFSTFSKIHDYLTAIGHHTPSETKQAKRSFGAPVSKGENTALRTHHTDALMFCSSELFVHLSESKTSC
jgi:hypothetical protein